MLTEIKIMPIAFAPRGEIMKVRKVGAAERIKKHLSELGITEGGNITLVSSSGGNVIVTVKDGRLCLDKTLAASILVG